MAVLVAVTPCALAAQATSQHRGRRIGPARLRVLVALAALVSCVVLVSASSGDRSRAYMKCVWKCVREDDCAGNPAPLPAHLAYVTVQRSATARPHMLTVCALTCLATGNNRLLGWDCQEECSYKCSHTITDMREQADLPVVRRRCANVASAAAGRVQLDAANGTDCCVWRGATL